MKKCLLCIFIFCVVIHMSSCNLHWIGEEALNARPTIEIIGEACARDFITEGVASGNGVIGSPDGWYKDLRNEYLYSIPIDCGEYKLYIKIEYHGHSRGNGEEYYYLFKIVSKESNILLTNPADFGVYEEIYNFYNNFFGTDVDFSACLEQFYNYEMLVEDFHENKRHLGGRDEEYAIDYSVITPETMYWADDFQVKLSYESYQKNKVEEDGSVTETYTASFMFGLVYDTAPVLVDAVLEKYPDLAEKLR